MYQITDPSLINLEDACKYLDKVNSIAEIMEFKDTFSAMTYLAHQRSLSTKALNKAKIPLVRAKRRLGFILNEIVRPTGRPGESDKNKRFLDRDGPKGRFTYKSPEGQTVIDVTEKESKRWRALSKVPEEEVVHYFSQCEKQEEEITENGLLALLNGHKNNKKKKKITKTKVADEPGVVEIEGFDIDAFVKHARFLQSQLRRLAIEKKQINKMANMYGEALSIFNQIEEVVKKTKKYSGDEQKEFI